MGKAEKELVEREKVHLILGLERTGMPKQRQAEKWLKHSIPRSMRFQSSVDVETPWSKTRFLPDPGAVGSFKRSESASGEAMRETGGREEGQILGELGGKGLESRKAGAETSMVESEATILSLKASESWIYALVTGVSVYFEELFFEATRSTHVEDDRSTNVAPAPESASEPVDPVDVSNLTTTSGGVPTSNSYLSAGIVISNLLATLRR